MLDRSNNRLNIIFTFWFMVVAIVPAICIGVALYFMQAQQIQNAITHELVLVGRFKEDRIVRWSSEIMDQVRLIGLSFEKSSSNIDVAGAYAIIRDEGFMYVVSSDGTPIVPAGTSVPDEAMWIPNGEIQGDSIHIQAQYWYFVHALSNGAKLIAVIPQEVVDKLLYENVNDAKFFTQNRMDGLFGLGKSADAFMLDARGDLIVRPLYGNDQRAHDILTLDQVKRIGSGDPSTVVFSTASLLVHARRVQAVDVPFVLVLTLDISEIATRMYAEQANILLIVIGSLIALLILLYIFVGNLSRLLIRPIYRSIVDLMQSSEKIKESIEVTERVVTEQEKTVAHLNEHAKSQAKTAKAVSTEIGEIVQALKGIAQQTAISGESVRMMDRLAIDGQHQTKEAQSSMVGIKRLSTSLDALVTSLNHYSDQIGSIARDMSVLAQEVTYLSLNANIEASKADGSTQSLSGIVSEVGKLSRMSQEASANINHLVQTIQSYLQETKISAAQELRSAEAGIKVIALALDSFSRLSKDTVKISASVKTITDLVNRQSSSTEAITKHADTVLNESRNAQRESTTIAGQVTEQNKIVKANVSAMKKLVASISQLSTVIGYKKK